jgi:hypothetical protein
MSGYPPILMSKGLTIFLAQFLALPRLPLLRGWGSTPFPLRGRGEEEGLYPLGSIDFLSRGYE